MDINNITLDDLETMNAEDFEEYRENLEGETPAQSVGTLPDDRLDPQHEPERLSPEAWKKGGFYAVTIKADPGDAAKAGEVTVKGYDDYIEKRDYLHERGYYIRDETFQTEADYFPGLLTYEKAVEAFKTADNRYLELEHFPQLSKIAKIRVHDSVVIAGKTSGGKSTLALNFLNDLNTEYPILYINLEMDHLTILRRLVAIQTQLELDRIEGYQNDEDTAAIVNGALQVIASRKPLQIVEDIRTIGDRKENGKVFPGIETIIAKTTKDREDPTVVIIDHALLTKPKAKNTNDYERFSRVSEELREIARRYNIIMINLLQQNRASSDNEDEPPTNSSLKNSGSWENDATKILLLWNDPKNLGPRQKRLLLTKNRDGKLDNFVLNWNDKMQTFTEAKDQTQGAALDVNNLTLPPTGKPSKRDQKREKLDRAREKIIVMLMPNGKSIRDVPEDELRQLFAEALDVTTDTVKKYEKEYNYNLQTGFTDISQHEKTPFDEEDEIIG